MKQKRQEETESFQIKGFKMFKNISIGQKIHLPIIILMIVGISVVIFNSLHTIDKITNDSRIEYIKNMRDDITQGLNEKEQIGLTSVIALSKNQAIIDALKLGDRQKAYKVLSELSQTYKETTDYKNIKIHIHTKDTKSFLRHWNKDKYGDDLSSFRFSLLKVKKTQEPFVSIESGRAGMLLRGIAPIFDQGEFIGSIEFIQGFNSVVKKYKKFKNYELLFLACNNDNNIKRFKKDTPKISGFYLSQNIQNTSLDLMKTLDGFNPKELELNNYLIQGKYFVTSLPLKSMNNKKEGFILIATDFGIVNNFVEESKNNLLEQVYILVSVDILLLLVVISILNSTIKRPIEELVNSIANVEKNLDKNDLRSLYSNNKFAIDSKDEISKIQSGLNVLLKKISRNFVKLQKNEKYTAEFVKAIDAGSIVSKSDTSGQITYVNDTLCKITGYTKEELIGKPHKIFRDPTTPKSVFKEMWQTIQSGNIYSGLFKNRKKDGGSFYANITIVPIVNEENTIVEYVALRDDVTELVNSKEELKKTFFTDPLTSFSNRFKLLDDITHQEHSYLGVIDIHDFRQINDFYGHEIGDEVIIDFSSRLFSHFDSIGYTVYRVHGDEFAILANVEQISQKAFYNHFKEFIENNKLYSAKIDKYEINIRLTCGISYNNEALVSESEIAHKTAKKEQKEILEYSTDINVQDEYKKNLEWTNKIKDAIDNKRIKAYFQPIVNAKNNKIEKYETLMRLIDKQGKEISPFFFLDIAKKSRLYKELTKIVVTQAFEKFSGTKYEFSINLSAEDIMLHDISSWFFELALEYKVSKQVVIELVESEGIESFDMMDTFIQNAKDNGMQIAIDDFGTGYSNFEYLIKLNTDYLKIDGSLIKEIDSNEKLYSVVETIVAFAKKNEIKTIAEFIASDTLYEKIQELDIDYGQGFYLGKPLAELVKE